MQVDAFVALLRAASAQIGTPNIFLDSMPATVTEGIVLLSPLGGNRIDWELGQLYRKDDMFQMIARSSVRARAMAIATAAVPFITILTQQTLPATGSAPQMTVLYSRPMQDPIIYPRQLSSLWEASTNFSVTYTLLPCATVPVA